MIAKSAPCFRYNGNCKIAILPFCFRYNGNWVFSISTSCFLCNRKIFCNFTPLFPVQWEILQKCQFSSFSHFKRKQDAFFEKIAVPFQKETGVFRIFGFSYYKRNQRLFKNTFPIFRTCCDTIYFSAEKRKTTASQGFPTVRGLFQFIMICVFSLFVSVIMGMTF